MGSALEGNYYFNPNRRQQMGYCSIVVRQANKAEHHGTWTCAGRLIGRDEESGDEFDVNVVGKIYNE